MSGVVALCLGFGGIVLFTFLLRNANIGGPTYFALLLLTLGLSYAIWRGEAVAELAFKDYRVVLRQVEQARSEVFAKADAVQQLAEQTARMAAWNISTANRFVGDDHTEQMLARRDEIIRMLRDVDIPSNRIQEIVRPINHMAERDYRADIWQDLSRHIESLNKGRAPEARVEPEPIRLVLIENYNRAELERLLTDAGIQMTGLESRLDALDEFRRRNGPT